MFAVGAVSGSAITGTLLGLLGGLTGIRGGITAIAILAGAGVLFLAADVGIAGLKTPTLRRQTNSTWWRSRGSSSATVLWGIDLGLGFTTIRVGSLYWLAALAVFLKGSPSSGATIMIFYGVGVAAHVFVGVFLLDRNDRHPRPNIRALALSHLMRSLLVAALAIWTVYLAVRIAD